MTVYSLNKLGIYIYIKADPGTVRGGPWGCETPRLPHFLDDRLIDGGKVSLTRRPPLTPRKIPGTHFC
jgi:hypothetical protein